MSASANEQLCLLTSAEPAGELRTILVKNLHRHPSMVSAGLAPSPEKISRLEALGERAFEDPVLVTQEGFIIDGEARVFIAEARGRIELLCRVCVMDLEEALCRRLRRQVCLRGLNDYCRIVLALGLESWLQEKAKANQRYGNQAEGSPTLTNLQPVDVRAEIASLAGVSAGNVSKVKYLQEFACEELRHALKSREIAINSAWRWSKAHPGSERGALKQYRDAKSKAANQRRAESHRRPETKQFAKAIECLLQDLVALRKKPNASALCNKVEAVFRELLAIEKEMA